MWEVAVLCNGWLPIHWALQLANWPSSKTTVLTERNLQPATPMCSTHTCTYAVWTGTVCVDCVLTSHTPWPSYLQCFILPSQVWYIVPCCLHSLLYISGFWMFPATGKESQHSKLIGMCGTIHVKDGYFDDLGCFISGQPVPTCRGIVPAPPTFVPSCVETKKFYIIW